MAYFINNPINCIATSSSLSGVTFHRIIAEIGIGGNIYKQSIPVSTEGQKVEFDISSSLRAYFDSQQDSAVTSSASYAGVSFSVKFYDEYMKGGQSVRTANSTSTFSGTAIRGGYTDRERLAGASSNNAHTVSLSLRPSAQMLVPAGSTMLHASRTDSSRTVQMKSVGSQSSTTDTNFETNYGYLLNLVADNRIYTSEHSSLVAIQSELTSCYNTTSASASANGISVTSLTTAFTSLNDAINSVLGMSYTYSVTSTFTSQMNAFASAYRSVYMRLVSVGNENVYVVKDDGKFVSFQFINTRGIAESAFARLSAESIKGGSSTLVRSLRETFSQTSHRFAKVDPSYAAFSFSSGFVTIDEAKWWAYEFGKSKSHWVLIDGLWIPCIVTVKDGANVFNLTKQEIPSVDFECVPDANGIL